MVRYCAALLLILLIAFPVSARDFWEFPNVTTVPDDAELLIHDPTLPAGEPDRRTRNVTMGSLQRHITGQPHVITQTENMADDTPLVRVVDKFGAVRMTIYANGAVAIQ